MAYRQNSRSTHPNTSGSTGGGLRPMHGTQCPCAVCTDLNSVADSVSSPRGRPGGSVAGQSLQSGFGTTSGDPTSDSIGKRSQGSGRDDSTRSNKRPTGKSSGTSGPQTFNTECIPDPSRQQDREPSPPPTAPKPCRDGSSGGGGSSGRDVPGGSGWDGQDGGRDGQGGGGSGGGGGPEGPGGGRGGDRPKTGGKGKTRRTPSGSHGRVGKGREGRDGNEVSRGGPKPRPLCISGGRYGDKGGVCPDDECDFPESEEEIVTPEKTTESEEQMYDQTVAETGGRGVAPYLPQPSDKAGPQPPAPMDPLGPWAVGKPDWTPLGGLTGTRPIVDRYTITRYSQPEWRQHNLETFEKAAGDTSRANSVAFNARACLSEVLTAASKNQREVTQRLQHRNAEVRQWLSEVKKSREDLWDEIKRLGIEDDRLRRIICVLEDIVHLVGESIELRTTRMEPDLTYDEVDKEMTKELGLVNEIKQLLQRTRDEIRKQLDSSRSAKHRIEQDIADKDSATRIDCANIHLRFDSPTIMFHEGAARFMDNQSTPESWEILSRENLNISQNERSKIRSLRAIIERVATDSCQDLLTQKAKTEDTITRHITILASVIEDLEDRLKWVLRSIVETEQLIREIKESVRKLDFPLKTVQSRLQARQDRPRNENTRDCPQYALVDEMKSIGEQAAAMIAQLAPAEEALVALLKTRSCLEKELQSKKKNLFIDRDRILRLRQKYPPAEALMTHAFSQCQPCR